MWIRAALVVVAYLVAYGTAAAVEIERLETNDGNTFLVVVGKFNPEDDLSAELNRLVVERTPAFVTFNSPGGSPLAAMRLGRQIRALGLNTAQMKVLDCSSACTLAFLGGLNRFAEAGALGVHKAAFADTTGLDTSTAVSAVQELTGSIIGYLSEMGVDPGLMQIALSYDSDDMRYLSSSEMEHLRVTSVNADVEAPSPAPAVTAAAPAATDARTGEVRHPSGAIMLRAAPDENAAELQPAWNSSRVSILGREGRWYRVRVNGSEGYAHETWIKVEGFASAVDDRKYIQTHSFPTIAAAQAAITALPYPADAYEVTSGWIAVTVRGKFTDAAATQTLAEGKRGALYPQDAFKTFGNVYVRKLCCN